MTSGQEKIVRKIAFAKKRRVVIAAHTRYGKSLSVSIGILLYLLLWKKQRIVLIGPLAEQASILRNYIAGFLMECPLLVDQLDIEMTGVDRLKKEVSKKRWTFKDNSELRTMTAEGTGSRLMGFGGNLIVVDESCLIGEDVYNSRILRMLGDDPDASIIQIGNPWHRDGQMWKAWTDPTWEKIHIPYNVGIQEGRITQEFIDEQKSVLGEDSLLFKVLWKAEFPEESEDQLIRFAWISGAEGTFEIPDEDKEIVMGVDVAEWGVDLTACTVAIHDKSRDLYTIIDTQAWGKMDLMPTVGKIAELAARHNVNSIIVDAIGVGSGVYSRLKELKDGQHIKPNIYGLKVGSSPTTDTAKDKFLNLKAENYWRLRELFENKKLAGVTSRELVAQLTKMKYQLSSAGKIQIIDPQDKSPDFADSLMLCCARVAQKHGTFRPYTGR